MLGIGEGCSKSCGFLDVRQIHKRVHGDEEFKIRCSTVFSLFYVFTLCSHFCVSPMEDPLSGNLWCKRAISVATTTMHVTAVLLFHYNQQPRMPDALQRAQRSCKVPFYCHFLGRRNEAS
ncbi:hypothetical protein TNCV_3773841 [Trichonephila clavipes]|nr:hypothetical protein TNCV_3773841 [Trichonephila clavipes]